MNILAQDIKYMKGVGPHKADLFKKHLKITSLRDLLYNFPFRYIDRTEILTINRLVDGMDYVQLRGKIVDFDAPQGEGTKRRIRAIFTDGTGYLDLVWFNGIKYVTDNYKIGQDMLILGKPTFFNGRPNIVHPEIETVNEQKGIRKAMYPRYHMSEKLEGRITQRFLSELVQSALHLVETKIQESLPSDIIEKHQFIDLYTALRAMHFPSNSEELAKARSRLKFEELFYLQLEILRYAKLRKKTGGFYFPKIADNFHQFYNQLPFNLTEAQKRVVKEIRSDFTTGKQMNRLVQGDVGSGKTLVALLSALIAVDNGFQACLMAPTEILAEQHVNTFKAFLKDLPVNVELLTSSVKGKQRKTILEDLERGKIQIIVGTHALIEPTVKFQNLGFCVIDEQHRFGVKQRAAMWEKNATPPHILVMTATPIPRTLAMTLYGDLDVSVIDELPPGRKPIQTKHYYLNKSNNLVQGINHELQAGRQIYVVYPLIEENEKSDLLDLQQGYENLCKEFPQYRVGKIHGKLKPADKEVEMNKFVKGETQILVATTVIEVGVNVPNATVMVIQHAERFGLAQLHQLRGRVGRGSSHSYCILLTPFELSAHTRRRMEIMVETNDGFIIAEEDLKLRGPGDLEGTAQSGLPIDLKISNLTRDADIMTLARETAQSILKADPDETLPMYDVCRKQLKLLKKQWQDFSEIS